MAKKKLEFIDIAIRVMAVIVGLMMLVALHFLRRAYVADQFVIPTDSMLPTLIPGDRVIVNKLIAGARIYDEFDFKEGVPMKSHRVKGLRDVEHNDIVVFNFPINRKKYKMKFELNYVYCKRVIGLPGDSVSIRGGFFKSNHYDGEYGDMEQQRILSMTPDSVIHRNVIHALPFDPVNYGWTIKEFGPLYVPHVGGKVFLTKNNMRIYSLAVEFETGKQLRLNKEGVLMLGDEVADEYTFTKDYYFICGDNVLNSNDSRYWGFVPREFIIGVVSHITYSKDKVTEEFRWNRLCKSVLKD